MKKRPTHKGFDQLAPFYDKMMQWAFGGKIAQSQMYFFKHIPDGSQVLILGGGTGFFLPQLLALKKNIRIDFIELSPKMITQARLNVPPSLAHQVEFHEADAFEFAYQKNYQVVITPYFIDLWLPTTAKKLVNAISKHCDSQAIWLFTDLAAEGSFKPLKRGFINLMYHICNAFCRLENKKFWTYADSFCSNTWQMQEKKIFAKGLISSLILRKRG